jgi:putative hemolysin
MTNRQNVVLINVKDTIEKVKQQVFDNPFSKYPVYDEIRDNIIGILTIKDFFHKVNTEDSFNLKDIITQPLYIPDNLNGIRIYEKFRDAKIYIAVVIDEYGSFEGLITLHDLIENIFGDLPEIHEAEVEDIFEREDGSMLIGGSVLIDELKEHLNLTFEEDENFSTLGGFVMYKLNRIPATGDKFDFKSYTFEVVDMDGNRVDKVLVTQKTIELKN